MVAVNNIVNSVELNDVIDPTQQPSSSNKPIDHPHTIDMRSDTVTQPTESMRLAMSTAVVGDDVFGDDPTINKLQDYAATLLGKEAALFCPSGTMCNLIACLVHCGERGSEMILGDKAHIHYYEAGNTAVYGNIHSRTVHVNDDGTLDLAEIESLIRPVDPHFPTTRLICLEQTQNLKGGVVLPTDYVNSVAKLAHQHNLQLHIDGARFFNAVTYLNEDPAVMLQNVDSISICLSKGLAAPIGSLLLGTKSFIDKARRVRKGLGGGTRQVGILGAAGLIAMQEMSKRLYIDHDNAQLLAKEMNSINGITINMKSIQTNIVYADIDPLVLGITAKQFIDTLATQYGVRGLVTGGNRIRFVLNYHITQQHVHTTIQAIHSLLKHHTK